MSSMELREPAALEPSAEVSLRAMSARLTALESKVADLAQSNAKTRQGLTIIVFSGETDKLMTAFMLATGAAAMNMSVYMFFTFWGLAAVRKPGPKMGKGIVKRLRSAMLPEGPGKLRLSRWNLFGLGRALFAHLVRKQNLPTLENLVELAGEMGVRMVACQTVMEVMGLRREDMLEGVEFGGAATCLDSIQGSGSTLLI
jgi:peroxiredoxin family protein